MANIRQEQFTPNPSSTRIRGELKDARANLDERIATFAEREAGTGGRFDEGQGAQGNNPNRLRRIVPATVALAGVVAVLGTGIGSGARSIAEDVWNLINGADTYGMLQHPYPEVNAEVRGGAISRSDITRVTVHRPTSAFGEAKALAGNDHNANPVANTIEHQQGDMLAAGGKLILQAGSIDQQTPQK